MAISTRTRVRCCILHFQNSTVLQTLRCRHPCRPIEPSASAEVTPHKRYSSKQIPASYVQHTSLGPSNHICRVVVAQSYQPTGGGATPPLQLWRCCRIHYYPQCGSPWLLYPVQLDCVQYIMTTVACYPPTPCLTTLYYLGARTCHFQRGYRRTRRSLCLGNIAESLGLAQAFSDAPLVALTLILRCPDQSSGRSSCGIFIRISCDTHGGWCCPQRYLVRVLIIA